MDRTVQLNDKEYIIKGRKLFPKKSFLPYECSTPFSVARKFICPKQVNDTVRIFFDGEYEIKEVYADNVLLVPEKGENGKIMYDVTAALKKGKTYICAYFLKGSVTGFFFDVKRNYGK